MSTVIIRSFPCRACGVLVFDLRHEGTGRSAPIEVEPVSDGNIVIDLTAGTYRLTRLGDLSESKKRHRNHFAACPQAQRFRRQRSMPTARYEDGLTTEQLLERRA